MLGTRREGRDGHRRCALRGTRRACRAWRAGGRGGRCRGRRVRKERARVAGVKAFEHSREVELRRSEFEADRASNFRPPTALSNSPHHPPPPQIRPGASDGFVCLRRRPRRPCAVRFLHRRRSPLRPQNTTSGLSSAVRSTYVAMRPSRQLDRSRSHEAAGVQAQYIQIASISTDMCTRAGKRYVHHANEPQIRE